MDKVTRLKDIGVGKYYWVGSPNARLAYVDGNEVWKIPLPRTDVHEVDAPVREVPCLLVACSLPDFPIEGVITNAGAQRHANLLRGLASQSVDAEWDHRMWFEVWCERWIGDLVQVKDGKAAERSSVPGRKHAEVYCAALLDNKGRTIAGQNPQVLGSPLASGSIYLAAVEDLTPIAKTKITGDPFHGLYDTKKKA